ncbi:MAG TPA: mechanosensitive ion channel domain-containing protein [Terriglobales bacterium]|nr:mechanosensitive ion channel domain-containing protein [Terriglobales bacterium]
MKTDSPAIGSRCQQLWLSCSLWMIAVLVLSLCSSAGGFAASQKVPGASPSAAPESAPPEPATAEAPPDIPLADIAARATEVSNLLTTLATAAAPSVENIAKSLPDLSQHLDAQLAVTKTILDGEPTLETLQSLQQQWQRSQAETTALLTMLTQQATKLQNGLNQLAGLEKTWSTTLTSAQAANAPEPILQQIDTTLKLIAETEKKIQTERESLLDLQSRVAQEITRCGVALAQIAQYQQKAVVGIFEPGAPPIWRLDLWPDAIRTLPAHVREVTGARALDVINYLREPRKGSGLHAAVFIFLAIVFFVARRKIAGWIKSGASISSALSVFERPFSAALVITIIFFTSPFFEMALPVRQILVIIALAPILRLIGPVVTPSVAALSYAVCAIFAVDTLRQAYAGVPMIGQAILVAETFVAVVVLIKMRRHYRQIIAERADSPRLVFFKVFKSLLVILLLISLLAGAAGYVRLAQLLTPGILVSGVLALAAFAVLHVASGVIAVGFRVWPLRALQMVEHHRDLIARRIFNLLAWIAIIGWLARYLSYLGLLDPAWSLVQAVLAARLERGTISLSVSNIIEFLATVSFAYLLSRFIRFVLQEDVYPRIALAPGLSYAVSSLLNYIVIALGFVAALGVLGVDFSKVSILAGAFGVGIGFGLQSIVNNFVSGLILLFERPMHVGDTVELGNLQGTVRRIGIRASVIHTGAGADIIVPNSQLITDKVTNWTLSDRLRRVDLQVGVNYGADPKRVIELLERTALAHPDVLREPAPRALFTAYGDSSINFELRVWPRQFHLAAQVKSDLATAVYDAVHAAGMSFPFPQREVRLLRD